MNDLSVLYDEYYGSGIDLSNYFGSDSKDISFIGFCCRDALKVIEACKQKWLTVLGVDVYRATNGSVEYFYLCWDLRPLSGESVSDRFGRSISESSKFIRSNNKSDLLFCLTIVKE